MYLSFFAFKEAFRLVQPVYIGKLVAYFAVGSKEERWKAYLYASIIIICSLGETFVHHPMFLGVMRAGMHLRIATSALIYRKVRQNLCIRTPLGFINIHTVKPETFHIFVLHPAAFTPIFFAVSYICLPKITKNTAIYYIL